MRFNYSFHCRYHILDILIRHTRVDGKRDHPLISMESDREVIGCQPICFSIKRMQMEWDEMHACAYLLLRKQLNKCGAVDSKLLQVQAQEIQMPGVLHMIQIGRNSHAR